VNAGDAGAVAEIFPTLESISIDNGVMEKAKELAVVPGSFGWSDVGSWQSAWELASKDGAGNALPEGAFVKDAERNYFTSLATKGTSKHVAFVGVSDLVVVETDDAVLVMPRERAQDVKLVVEALKKAGKTELL
jgi:mannose-1-phosphate guanylyltransferase